MVDEGSKSSQVSKGLSEIARELEERMKAASSNKPLSFDEQTLLTITIQSLGLQHSTKMAPKQG